MGKEESWEEFVREAMALGVVLQESCKPLFALYLRELQDWNRSVRLVSRADPETVIWAHFLDSLAVVPLIQGEGPLLDVGSGAGFPGIPVKLARPSMAVHLVEPRRRKANFLRHLVRVLELERVWVHQARVGREGLDLGRFPLVVARAIATPLAWLELAKGLVAPGGRVFLFLGHGEASLEIEICAARLGWEVVNRADYTLPKLKRRRSILVMGRKSSFT